MITRGKRRLAAVALLIGGLVVGSVSAPAEASTVRTVIALPDAPLTITAPSRPVRYAASAKVSVHLGATAARRMVAVYAKQNGQKRQLLIRHAVDAQGNLVVNAPGLHKTTVVSAEYAGDKSYAATTVSDTVQVRVKLTGHMVKSYGHQGRYALYHNNQTPHIYGKVLPNKYCPPCATGIVFYPQQLIKGKWVAIPNLGLMNPVSRRSDVTVAYPLTHKVGQRFRFEVFYWGDADNAKTHGPWLYLQFTK